MNTSVTAESAPFLILLLKMDAFFDIEVAKAHVSCHLESHPDLDLTTKLHLCHRFKVILWLSPTFKALVSQPIESLDPLGLDLGTDSASHPACLDLTQAPDYISQVNFIGSCHTPCNGIIFLHHTSIMCPQVGGAMEGRACGDVAPSRNLLCRS
ncbi:hypothetical protein M405DRAFT_428188 [Rhizopogon salebrosus TDB-379]|nr:hypothetical protein M405DRAFT_428188 [Rhizopogon salebrosus TDB-379]